MDLHLFTFSRSYYLGNLRGILEIFKFASRLLLYKSIAINIIFVLQITNLIAI